MSFQIQSFLLCEAMNTEKGSKLTDVHRIFDSIAAQAFPATKSCAIYCRLVVADEKTCAVSITAMSPSLTEREIMAPTMVTPDPNGKVVITFRMDNLNIPQAGIYTLLLRVNGKACSEFHLTAVKRSTVSSKTPMRTDVATALPICDERPAVPSSYHERLDPADSDITRFYESPSAARVGRIIVHFNALIRRAQPAVPTSLVVGFLAAAFGRYAGKIDELIVGASTPQMLELVAIALRLAGQVARAQSVADRVTAAGGTGPNFDRVPNSLEAVTVQGPAEFDVMWGASFATGDPRYCEKRQFKSADVRFAYSRFHAYLESQHFQTDLLQTRLI